jgi:hypothetical protein
MPGKRRNSQLLGRPVARVRPLLDLLSLSPLRAFARDLRSGSGLTANRINLPYASELYPAFNFSSCSPRPALCYRPLLALPAHFHEEGDYTRARDESQWIAAWKQLYQVRHPGPNVSRLQTISYLEVRMKFDHQDRQEPKLDRFTLGLD